MRHPTLRRFVVGACLLATWGCLFWVNRTADIRPVSLAARPESKLAISAKADPAGVPPASVMMASSSAGSPTLFSVGRVLSGTDRPRFPARYGTPAKAEEFSRAVEINTPTVAAIAALRPGDRVSLPYFDGRVLAGVVAHTWRDSDGQIRLVGVLDIGGRFNLSTGPKGLGGRIMPEGEATVAVVRRTKGGEAYLVEKSLGSVICVAYPSRRVPAGVNAPGLSGGGGAIIGAQPVFNSRPEATAVAYLDFDGETVPAGEWSTTPIEASSSGFSDEQIEETWRRVAEDYRAFNINVTTDPARYAAAPVGSRMRCILTLTSDAAPGSGGVAALGSWADAATPDYSDDIPCWVFTLNVGFDAKGAAEAASHEIAHTLGLSHDGLKDGAGDLVEDYYEGRGNGATGWAPIMGVGYYQALTQWSRGDYTDGVNFANNQEDDLAIISSAINHTRYVKDLVPSESADSTVFALTGAGAAEVMGVIESTGDIDSYAVTVSAGAVTFTVSQATADNTASGLSNLDAQLALYDAGGTLVSSANPEGALFPQLTATVAGGTYFLKLQAAGEGTGIDTGYPAYGSLGRYRVVASFEPAAGLVPTIVGAGEVVFSAGAISSYAVQATAAPAGYVASGLPDGVSIHPATGVISGTVAVPGSYPFTVQATNAAGSATRAFTLRVIAGTPAQAVDAPALVWSTGGDLPWIVDDADYETGFASARSGGISVHSTQSWIETTVSGPGQLAFDWKVSSEENTSDPGDPYDRLEFAIDGVRQEWISGETDWARRTVSIPPGVHVLRWTYQKDPYASVGEDAGWLDGVVYARDLAPAVSIPAAAVITTGNGYGFQIVATDAPTSYSANGLPPGLSLNAATGFIGGVPTSAGEYEVTLRATNAQGTGNATLLITVRSRFASWVDGYGLVAEEAAASADPDGDGFGNLLEYALGFDPMAVNLTGGPGVTLADDARLEIEFVRPADRAELRYTVEVTTDLMLTWQSGHAYGAGADNTGELPTQEIARTPLGDGRELIRVRDALPDGEARRFMRLKITSQ